MRIGRLLAALVLLGCSSGTDASSERVLPGDGNGDTAPDGGADPATPQEPPAPPALVLDDVHVIANLDDDDGNGVADWEDFLGVADADLAALTLTLPRVDEGYTYELHLVGDAGVRLWWHGAVVLGESETDILTTFSLPSETSLTLLVEAAGLHTAHGLTLVELSPAPEAPVSDGGAEDMATPAASAPVVARSVAAQILSAPLILSHHLETTEHVWVLGVNGRGSDNNAQMVQDMETALGDMLTVLDDVTYEGDPWVQDELEIGRTATADFRADVVLDSIRNRGLNAFPKTLLAADTWVGTWGPDRVGWGGNPYATSQDSFGNLEASPPVTVDGVHYPFGRVYWGGSPSDNPKLAPNEDLIEMLDAQGVQAPFKIDTSWLCVGHVDEFISFVPDRGSPKGFKLVYADVNAAYELLETLPLDYALPRYAEAEGYDTVGDLLKDSGLWVLNDELQTDVLDGQLEVLKAALGLTEDDVIRMPALFSDVPRCGGVAALIPGTVNMLVVNHADGRTELFAPDPFFRSDAEAASADPVALDFERRMPEGVTVHWLDAWYVYHLGLGEVHCGTNQRRTPAASDTPWWPVDGAAMEVGR